MRSQDGHSQTPTMRSTRGGVALVLITSNTLTRKNWLSFSFAKLMQSCSKPFRPNASKPNTSSSPMKRRVERRVSRREFIRNTCAERPVKMPSF
eukprot:scaffold51787_cov30-Tisochrysis_lutea.AAC.7